MVSLKSKIIGTIFGAGLGLLVGATANAEMIIDVIPYCEYYNVKKGDNLTKIAEDYGTTINSIRRANYQYEWDKKTHQFIKKSKIENPDLIFPGQSLNIPQLISITPQSSPDFIQRTTSKYYRCY